MQIKKNIIELQYNENSRQTYRTQYEKNSRFYLQVVEVAF